MIDKKVTRIHFNRAAKTYDQAAFLQQEMATRLLERLDFIKITPRRILDLGCGTGLLSDMLTKRYRGTECIALDFADALLKQAKRRGSWLHRPVPVCADAEALPFPGQTFDLICSNAMMQWLNPPILALQEIKRTLRPQGLLLFTTFGSQTLKELRTAWAEIDDQPHVSEFLDMQDLGDMMRESGLKDTVVDTECITVTYDHFKDILRSLKDLGATNTSPQRQFGLLGKTRFARLEAAYEQFRTADKLSVTWDIVYGHAWAPGIGQQQVQFRR